MQKVKIVLLFLLLLTRYFKFYNLFLEYGQTNEYNLIKHIL